MKPIRLTMQAFGSYAERTEIDFTKPTESLFLVTGDTGAGKTTIFDAIVFALFGEASSGHNKKDGKELQSQFADLSVEPYVQLEFSQTEGGSEQIYTVFRSPRHVRPAKRSGGAAEKEVNETVSLFLPDGQEFPAKTKETNIKLSEIVGLTKEEFMQVGMLAQGEFMDVLRADSNTKKTTFRKLFRTERFYELQDRVKERMNLKQAERAELVRSCEQDLNRLRLPEEGFDDLKGDVLLSEKENLTEKLEALCRYLKEKADAAGKEEEAARVHRDQIMEEASRADQLNSLYLTLTEAEEKLKKLEEESAKIEKLRREIPLIRSAYELNGAFHQLEEGKSRVDSVERDMKEGKSRLPDLERAVEEASAEKQKAASVYTKAAQDFAKINAEVKKALDVFNQLKNGEKQKDSAQKNFLKKEEELSELDQKLQQLSDNRSAWNQESESLSGAEEEYSRNEHQKQELTRLWNETENLKAEEKNLESLFREAETVQNRYRKAVDASLKKQEYAEKLNTLFFNEQAGILASEKLVSGEPCPVCGSIHHPAPATLSMSAEIPTREAVDAARKDADLSRKAYETLAVEAGRTDAAAKQKINQVSDAADKLYRECEENLKLANQSILSLADARNALISKADQVKKALEAAQKDKDRLYELRRKLKEAENDQTVLSEKKDTCSRELTQAKSELTAAWERVQALTEQKTYKNEQIARETERIAGEQKKRCEAAWKEAEKKEQTAATLRDALNARLEKLKEELPREKERLIQKENEFHALLQSTPRPENRSDGSTADENWWKTVVQLRNKEDADSFQKQVTDWGTQTAKLRGEKESAIRAIGERPKPDMDRIVQEREAADKNWNLRKTEEQELRSMLETDEEIRKTVGKSLKKYETVNAEAGRLTELYRRLSGNISGSRMDLETYVQRAYLQKILYSANRRFLEMSAGQYELRMTDEEEAGKGKNRGLDLMVYSYVTGRTREVRTLSGGESFMAALALALGTADQIQERSGSVQLDVMFIDEGFGSLDDRSRNEAVRVLQQMSGSSNKLIGIISHVTELKQALDNQLIVTKGEKGSRVSWQIS